VSRIDAEALADCSIVLVRLQPSYNRLVSSSCVAPRTSEHWQNVGRRHITISQQLSIVTAQLLHAVFEIQWIVTENWSIFVRILYLWPPSVWLRPNFVVISSKKAGKMEPVVKGYGRYI